jgi:hypothetical protein
MPVAARKLRSSVGSLDRNFSMAAGVRAIDFNHPRAESPPDTDQFAVCHRLPASP